MDKYFDLTNATNDVDTLYIGRVDNFNCILKDGNGKSYTGFLLSKSKQGNIFVVCDTNFQKSATDKKYQPRLTFRKIDPKLQDKHARADVDHIRIPFLTGEDGYRQFWKMIFFLYKFKEMIDFGDFDSSYHMITGEQLTGILNDKQNFDNIQKAANELGIEVSSILRTSTTLKMLKIYHKKLSEFIKNGVNETAIQNWLDENDHKYRQSRCTIFGLEFIEFKREGSSSSKRFDILTRVGSSSLERILIELKSPTDDIFEIDKSETINDQTTEYKLHDKLSRAIPQILGYRSSLNEKESGDQELEKLGIIKGKANIEKCIIIIGKNHTSDVWRKNRSNLVRSLSSSLEIWTYTDLLNKLDATIKNLESNISLNEK
jgi:hypothetical protein